MIVRHVPSPLDAAPRKVAHTYRGRCGPLHDDMLNCDQSGRLVAHTTKMYPTDDCTFFLVTFFLLIKIDQVRVTLAHAGIRTKFLFILSVIVINMELKKTFHTIFQVLARIMSGTLYAGQTVRVLGENYSTQDEEDSRIMNVGRLWIYEARYKVRLIYFRCIHQVIYD